MNIETVRHQYRHSFMTLYNCRRVQVLLFIFIIFIYLTFLTNILYMSFFGSQTKDTNTSIEDLNNLNTSHFTEVDKQNNYDNNWNKGEHDENNTKVKTNPSKSQVSNYCRGRICINKCCPVYKGFESTKNMSCVTDSFNNITYNEKKFFEKSILIINKKVLENGLRYKFIYTSSCSPNTTDEFEISEVSLVNDGHIAIGNNLYKLLCLDFVVGSKTILAKACFKDTDGYVNSDYEWNVYENEALSAETGEILFYLITGFVLSSNLSIVFIIVVYSCIPQLQNIHGKIVICYLISVVLFNLLFIFNIMVSALYNIKHIGLEIALCMALISWISWLTVMCYDIWFTFSRSLHAHSFIRPTNSKFRMYSIFCLGNVILHTSLQALVMFKNSEVYIISLFIKFKVTLNLVMFLSTLLNLRFHRANIPVNVRHGDPLKEGIFLYSKLSLLMGIDWLLVLGCFNFDGAYGVFVGVIIIQSQGITLLFLLVCNKHVFSLLRKNNRPS